MKKLVHFIFTSTVGCCGGLSHAQTIPVVVHDSTKLQGKGAFRGIDPDRGQSFFVNYLKNAPVETALGKYDPDAFPTISVVNTLDPVLNKPFPNWSVSWKVEGSNFANATRNKKTPNLGIPFMFDIKPFYGGYGVQCVDYVNEQNPANGQAWNADTSCADTQYNANFGNLDHTIANFASAIPFEQRAGGGLGAGLDKITEWAGISNLDYFYDYGGQVGSVWFGQRDWVNGKANVGLGDLDNEATRDPQKSLALLLGMGEKSQGYVFDQYGDPLESVYIDPSKYPLDFNNPNSAYPIYTQRIDGTTGSSGAEDGNINANNIPTSSFWNLAYKISIPSRFKGAKGLADYPNVLPCTEVASLSSSTYRQGESFVYDMQGSTRVVNKFGLGANTKHVVARVIFAGEIHKWFAKNKLGNRKMLLQAKILCDQHQNGILTASDYADSNQRISNTALANKHFDREYSFDIGAFVAFTGCEWNIWDRNQQAVNLDGYHGAFGLINLLNQRKKFGTGAKSFVDLKPTANFLLWQSEISYDGGTTFVKDKANNYVMTQTKIPQRQFVTPDGYWGGFLARPENTENTSCVLRLIRNGVTYTYKVSADMWETVDYDYRKTALSDLPNDKKDYHYFLLKLNGSGGFITENTK